MKIFSMATVLFLGIVIAGFTGCGSKDMGEVVGGESGEGVSILSFTESGNEFLEGKENIISYHYGTIDAEGQSYRYTIEIESEDDRQYLLKVQFSNEDAVQVQQFSFDIPDDFRPSTISEPLQIADINRDGNSDLIINLGIFGRIQRAVCYVYSYEQKEFVELEGFNGLCSPEYIGRLGVILEMDNGGSPVNYYYNKYEVVDDKLQLIASLHVEYGASNAAYTESQLIDGKMTVIKDKVDRNEIDLNEWDYRVD